MKRDTESGIALFSVLWGLLALSVIAVLVTSITYRTRVEAGSYRAETQMRHAAMGAIELAIRDLLDTPRAGQREFLKETHTYSVGEFEVPVHISDESGRINFNLADEALITSLLEYVGEEKQTARGIAQALLDWRDENDVAMALGAEALEYAALGQPGRPRNAPFQSVGELARVAGMTREILDCIRPLATVYSGSTLDKSVATDALKAFLEYEEGDEETPHRVSLLNPNTGNGIAVYRFDAEIELTGRRYDHRVIVRLTGRQNRPWTTLFSGRSYSRNYESNCNTLSARGSVAFNASE